VIEKRESTAIARRKETRRRMQEALQDPEFAGAMQQALAGEDPKGDELLDRAWAGEFGEEVFNERYPAARLRRDSPGCPEAASGSGGEPD
jgi:hypothetical protein